MKTNSPRDAYSTHKNFAQDLGALYKYVTIKKISGALIFPENRKH